MNSAARKQADLDDVRTARLFRNGRSQAVRIPKEFELEGEEVTIRRDKGGKLVLEPIRKARTAAALLGVLKRMEPVPDFPADPGDEDFLPLDEPDF
jgi:antitoxin VapB